MTAATAPAGSLLRVPRLSDLRGAMHVDRAVAITAIICGALVAVAIVAGLVAVVVYGGDVAAVATAIGGIASAVILAVARRRTTGDQQQ